MHLFSHLEGKTIFSSAVVGVTAVLINQRVVSMIRIKTVGKKIVPWGYVMVSSTPLVGLSIAAVFTVLLCTWDKSDTSYAPVHLFHLYLTRNINEVNRYKVIFIMVKDREREEVEVLRCFLS